MSRPPRMGAGSCVSARRTVRKRWLPVPLSPVPCLPRRPPRPPAAAGAAGAGRGACAGPLVAAACVLPAGRRGRVPELADSKLLTAAARERVYAEVVDRAVSWSVVVIPVGDLDARGMHVTNIEALRRAVCALQPGPDYVLTDGFPVTGLARPALAVWKGDRVAACVAAGAGVAGGPRAP